MLSIWSYVYQRSQFLDSALLFSLFLLGNFRGQRLLRVSSSRKFLVVCSGLVQNKIPDSLALLDIGVLINFFVPQELAV